MHKYFTLTAILAPLLSFASLPPNYSSETPSYSKPSHQLATTRNPFYHPYIGVGFSTLAVLPYAGNVSIGMRTAAPNLPIGVDVSGNYTTSFASQYYFLKTMLPIYVDQANPLNSYYVGPYLCTGYQNVSLRNFNLVKPGWLLINGIAVGKNFEVNDNLSFAQISANFARLEAGSSLDWESWPTLTFQYGIGF